MTSVVYKACSILVFLTSPFRSTQLSPQTVTPREFSELVRKSEGTSRSKQINQLLNHSSAFADLSLDDRKDWLDALLNIQRKDFEAHVQNTFISKHFHFSLVFSYLKYNEGLPLFKATRFKSSRVDIPLNRYKDSAVLFSDPFEKACNQDEKFNKPYEEEIHSTSKLILAILETSDDLLDHLLLLIHDDLVLHGDEIATISRLHLRILAMIYHRNPSKLRVETKANPTLARVLSSPAMIFYLGAALTSFSHKLEWNFAHSGLVANALGTASLKVPDSFLKYFLMREMTERLVSERQVDGPGQWNLEHALDGVMTLIHRQLDFWSDNAGNQVLAENLMALFESAGLLFAAGHYRKLQMSQKPTDLLETARLLDNIPLHPVQQARIANAIEFAMRMPNSSYDAESHLSQVINFLNRHFGDGTDGLALFEPYYPEIFKTQLHMLLTSRRTSQNRLIQEMIRDLTPGLSDLLSRARLNLNRLYDSYLDLPRPSQLE